MTGFELELGGGDPVWEDEEEYLARMESVAATEHFAPGYGDWRTDWNAYSDDDYDYPEDVHSD